MNEPMWKSTVLLCNPGDDECLVCRFLEGDWTPDVLLHVIGVLDTALAEKEQLARTLESIRCKN
ncbi:MAG: hypothetical protein HQ581_27695 [Planctomycetes bacterium]|nr:hypothetical protein [Planctomycetota bacterium]